MILCFQLSMPNVGSWNGKWSGKNDYYAIIKNMGRSKKAAARTKEILGVGNFRYDFGDGWAAGVRVEEVNTREAAKRRRKSTGFCGYDWMVASILSDLKIIPPS